MSRAPLTRRSVLRGILGGGAVVMGLPPLQLFFDTNGTKDASGGAMPKRFGLFYWGNGVVPDKWVPTGTGTSYTLSELLAPLAAVQDDVTIVTGMSVQVPNRIPHYSGASGILCGAPIVHTDHDTFALPTIDQIIAAKVGTATRFRSLEFGAKPGFGSSYNGPDNQNPPENSPRALFDRVFGPGYRAPGSEQTVDPTLRLRRSILDAVLEDSKALKKRLGAADRQRLDQHFEGVRALESRLLLLDENPATLAACASPATPEPAYPDIDGRPQLSVLNRLFCDIAAMALACDQTRVVSNYFTASINNLLFPRAPGGHHQLTHDELGDQPNVSAIVVQIVAEFAYFVEKLRSVPEGDGTLLDHTVLLGTSDCSFGRTHSLDEFPILLAGTANGALRKGLHYRSSTTENASKVMLSIVRAMDVPAADFGADGGRVTDGLGAIET